jgi:hypothetical protein
VSVGERVQASAPSAPARTRERGGPGRALPAAHRADAERALGHDFAGVRVHACGAAAGSARSRAGALAYSFGDHLVFGAGAYAPGTPAGDRLIVHELAHVAQQRAVSGPTIGARAAERQADAAAAHVVTRRRGRAPISRRPLGVHRQPPPTTQQAPPTTTNTPRGRFERWLAMRFPGVRVAEGTRERQTREVFGRRVPGATATVPTAQQVLPNWHPWAETAAAADLYDNATRAIEDVAGAFSGSPNITEVVLYATEYTLTAGGAVPTGNVGASFGAGQLTSTGPRRR